MCSSERELSDPVYQDQLTGIGNRRHFERRLQAALSPGTLQEGHPALLLLDLDRFKAVNDSLGHAVGDILLRLVAERISQLTGRENALARLGGDEFGIIAGPGVEPGDLARRLIDLVERTYLVEGYPVNIGVSIGIARAPQDGSERGELLRNADLALYQAKATGRSCFLYFDRYMAIKAKERRDLEIALRKAVPLRQLELYYRPLVDITTNRLVGLESVLHWKHATRGLLPPSEFIPLAEEVGVIVAVGEWALKAACQEAARWPDEVTFSMRVSPLQFETERFFDAVEKALQSNGISGSRLELAITESILLRDGRSVLAVLHKLRAIGVRVALDGFGTGIASLSQMVEFPLDTIKIDRRLTGVGTGTKQRAIVRAIAALGEGLGVSTLVEGVATSEQLLQIQNDGCSSLQGYLSADTVSTSELRESIRELLVSNLPHEKRRCSNAP